MTKLRLCGKLIFMRGDICHPPPGFLSRQRALSRKLRQSRWWREKIRKGLCAHCGQKFKPEELTMDHLIPLAQGGMTEKANIAAACKACNSQKGRSIPLL